LREYVERGGHHPARAERHLSHSPSRWNYCSVTFPAEGLPGRQKLSATRADHPIFTVVKHEWKTGRSGAALATARDVFLLSVR